MIRTRAIVFEGPGVDLALQDVLVSGPAPDEVLVRTAACGACHSDVNKINGRGTVKPPCVFGHEISGVVVEVGSGVDAVAIGDAVLCGFVVPCGACASCVAGLDEECLPFRLRMQRDGVRFDGTPRYFRADGRPLRASGVGGLAQLVPLPVTAVAPIPSELVRRVGLRDVAVLGCAGLTAYNVVHVAAGVRADEVVLVLAAGGVGLCATAVARDAGARRVIVADVRGGPLRLAATFGADATVNLREQDLSRVVRDMTDGRGADAVIDTIGAAETVRSAMALVRTGGRVAVSGLAGAEAAVDLTRLVRDKITLVGSFGTHTRGHLPAVLDLAARGALDPARLVTRRFPLHAAGDAYGAVAAGEVDGRALIEFPRHDG